MKLDVLRIRRGYAEIAASLHRLEDTSVFIMKQQLGLSEVHVLRVESRVKSLESILTKAETKSASDPLEEFGDLVGLRVVTQFKRDIAAVRTAAEECFTICEVDDKIAHPATPQSFWYEALHLTVRLKEAYSGPHYDSYKDRCVELQVRSAAMDAWAVVVHSLGYKPDQALPDPLLRELAAVSAQYFSADTLLDAVATEADNLSAQWREAWTGGDLAQVAVNTASLGEYVRARFSERRRASDLAVGAVASELVSHGFCELQKVEDAVRRGGDAAQRVEAEEIASAEREALYSDALFVLLCANLASESFASRHGDDTHAAVRSSVEHLLK